MLYEVITLHQPYRKSLIPNFDQIKEKAYAFGAHAFYLSGAGPTMGCIISDNNTNFTVKMSQYIAALGKYNIIISPTSTKGAEII